MSHSHSSKGSRQYRYYVCQRAQQRGWQECPAPSVPAGEIERFVIDQIKCVGRDPRMIKETLDHVHREAKDQIKRLRSERGGLCGQLRDDHADLGRLAATSRPGDPRLVDVHDRIREAERRVTQVDEELATLKGDLIDETEVATALSDFGALWECLASHEQSRVIELLIERIVYNGEAGHVSITFRPSGIKILAGELADRKEEVA